MDVVYTVEKICVNIPKNASTETLKYAAATLCTLLNKNLIREIISYSSSTNFSEKDFYLSHYELHMCLQYIYNAYGLYETLISDYYDDFCN